VASSPVNRGAGSRLPLRLIVIVPARQRVRSAVRKNLSNTMSHSAISLDQEDHGYLPSKEDVRFYKEHGWFLTLHQRS
jgi:hypothetical protein